MKVSKKTKADFIFDVLDGSLIKTKEITFKQLAEEYGFTEHDSVEVAANKCKKCFYKTLKQKYEISLKQEEKMDLSIEPKMKLARKWEVNTPEGIKTLHSYKEDTSSSIINELKDLKNELINDIKTFVIPVYKERKTKDLKVFENEENTLILSLPDYHIGREKDDEVCINTYLDMIESIVSRAILCSNINQIVYVIGNDLFNSDTPDLKTTKGTQQYDYQTYRENFLLGRSIIINSLLQLKSFNIPIKVLFVEGNHDHNKIFMLSQIVEATFIKDSQIEVIHGNRFHALKFGKNLLMFDHGELKNDDYPYLMATEYPQLWGETTNRYVFNGHLHHTIYKDYRGNVKVMYLPSLATNSSWEKHRGYNLDKQAQAHIINKDKGLVNIIHEYPNV